MLFDNQFELPLKECGFVGFFFFLNPCTISDPLLLLVIVGSGKKQQLGSSVHMSVFSSALLCFVEFGAAEPQWLWKCQNYPHAGADSICSHV